MKKITVLIADDHMIVCQGLKQLLQTAGDMEVVGEAQTGEAAVRGARDLRPNVVLLDIAMPQLNGIEAAMQIHKDVPSAGILMLSTYHEDQDVSMAIAAGARGYMMKESAGGELLAAVREISKGHSFFSAAITQRRARQARRAFFTTGDDALLTKHLTERELQTLRLVAEGNANQVIAERMGISIKTVEKHRQSVMNKLDIHEVAGLTRYAVSAGIAPCAGPSLVPPDTAPHALHIPTDSPGQFTAQER